MRQNINFGKLLHGGDYNPEQWLEYPEILEQDLAYFKKAKINEVSLGIFSWAFLEPEEGVFDLEWLRNIRKYSAWMRCGREICTESVITIAIPRRCTGKKRERSIQNWQKRSGIIQVSLHGIFRMN